METKTLTLNQNEVSVLRTLLRIYVDEQKELLEQRISDGRDKDTLPKQIKENETLLSKLD